jgi:hypothetical protein
MGFRFRKSIRLFPGVRLNISKGGFSTSVGRPGATVNIGKRGVRGTVGLPGSGLSYSEMLVKRREDTGGLAYEANTPSLASSPIKKLMFFVVLGILGIVAVLFVAGLMSAKQSSPIGGQVSRVAESGASDATQPPIDKTDIPDRSTVMSAGAVNCRSNPNSKASVVTLLTGNEHLTVLDRQGDWSRVTDDTHDCWVSSSLVG